jgi:hypothetical protein
VKVASGNGDKRKKGKGKAVKRATFEESPKGGDFHLRPL